MNRDWRQNRKSSEIIEIPMMKMHVSSAESAAKKTRKERCYGIKLRKD